MKPTSTTCQLEFASEHRCFAMMQHHSWLLMNRGTQPWYLKEDSHRVSRRHAKKSERGSTCFGMDADGLLCRQYLSRQVFLSRVGGCDVWFEKCGIAAIMGLKKRRRSCEMRPSQRPRLEP